MRDALIVVGVAVVFTAVYMACGWVSRRWVSSGRHHKDNTKWWMEDWRAYPDLTELAKK